MRDGRTLGWSLREFQERTKTERKRRITAGGLLEKYLRNAIIMFVSVNLIRQ